MKINIELLMQREEGELLEATQKQTDIKNQLHKLDKQNRNLLEEIMLRTSRIEMLNGMLEEEN